MTRHDSFFGHCMIQGDFGQWHIIAAVTRPISYNIGKVKKGGGTDLFERDKINL